VWLSCEIAFAKQLDKWTTFESSTGMPSSRNMAYLRNIQHKLPSHSTAEHLQAAEQQSQNRSATSQHHGLNDRSRR
jgi:hypothetical protein